jgi:hypothetical protein
MLRYLQRSILLYTWWLSIRKRKFKQKHKISNKKCSSVYCLRVGLKIGPVGHFIVESLSGAFSADSLSVSHESKVGIKVSLLDATVEQQIGGVQGDIVRHVVVESANEADTNTEAVESGSVCSNSFPAAAFVHVTVLADKEVVANVRPAVDVHVRVLEASDQGGACVKVLA